MAEEQTQAQQGQSGIPMLDEFAGDKLPQIKPDAPVTLADEEEERKRRSRELEEVARIMAIPDRNARFNEIVNTFGDKPDGMVFTDDEGWKAINAKMKELGTDKYFAMPAGKYSREEIIARHKELVAEYFPEGTKFDVITVNEVKEGKETGKQIHIIVGITLKESTGVDKFDKLRKMLEKEQAGAKAKNPSETKATEQAQDQGMGTAATPATTETTSAVAGTAAAASAAAAAATTATSNNAQPDHLSKGNPMADQEFPSTSGTPGSITPDGTAVSGSQQGTVTIDEANVTGKNMNIHIRKANLALPDGAQMDIASANVTPSTAMTSATASSLTNAPGRAV